MQRFLLKFFRSVFNQLRRKYFFSQNIPKKCYFKSGRSIAKTCVFFFTVKVSYELGEI